jgi:hypothetical protein
VAQLGRAFGSGPKGRRFKSSHPDHEKSLTAERLFLLSFIGFGSYLSFPLLNGEKKNSQKTKVEEKKPEVRSQKFFEV